MGFLFWAPATEEAYSYGAEGTLEKYRDLGVLKEAPNQTPARRWGLPHHNHEKINPANNVNKLVLQEIPYTVLGNLDQRHQLCHAWTPAPGNEVQL